MNKLIRIATLLPLLAVGIAQAQNLVTDGSFNAFSPCYSCWNGSDGHTTDWGARMITNSGQLGPMPTPPGATRRHTGRAAACMPST